VTPDRERLPERRRSLTQKMSIHDEHGRETGIFVTTSIYEDGRLGEVFVGAAKMGTTMRGVMDALAMVISIALQHGTPVEALVAGLEGTQYPPSGAVYVQDTEGPKPFGPDCVSITDLLARVLSAYAEAE